MALEPPESSSDCFLPSALVTIEVNFNVGTKISDDAMACATVPTIEGCREVVDCGLLVHCTTSRREAQYNLGTVALQTIQINKMMLDVGDSSNLLDLGQHIAFGGLVFGGDLNKGEVWVWIPH